MTELAGELLQVGPVARSVARASAVAPLQPGVISTEVVVIGTGGREFVDEVGSGITEDEGVPGGTEQVSKRGTDVEAGPCDDGNAT